MKQILDRLIVLAAIVGATIVLYGVGLGIRGWWNMPEEPCQDSFAIITYMSSPYKCDHRANIETETIGDLTRVKCHCRQ